MGVAPLDDAGHRGGGEATPSIREVRDQGNLLPSAQVVVVVVVVVAVSDAVCGAYRVLDALVVGMLGRKSDAVVRLDGANLDEVRGRPGTRLMAASAWSTVQTSASTRRLTKATGSSPAYSLSSARVTAQRSSRASSGGRTPFSTARSLATVAAAQASSMSTVRAVALGS